MTMGEKGGREEGREGANAPSNTCTSNDSLCTSYKNASSVLLASSTCVWGEEEMVWWVRREGGRVEGGGEVVVFLTSSGSSSMPSALLASRSAAHSILGKRFCTNSVCDT